jgi:uncharacterized protein (DUF362 family)
MKQIRPQATPSSHKRPLVVAAELRTYATTVPVVLDALKASDVLGRQKRILIKPNLIEARAAPVTTDIRCVEALIGYCRGASDAEIVVADGAGGCDTSDCFARLGYNRLARDHGVELVDLNHAETVTLTDESNNFLKQFHIPQIVLESYLISVPVLKAHSMTDVTLGMKNMIGVAPEKYYGAGGHYKKWRLHKELDQAIIEINKFRKPDLTLIDAAVGMATAHLWGPKCDPPVGKIVASFDPVAADRVGCDLLNKDWRQVGHIVMADGLLGQANAEVRLTEP